MTRKSRDPLADMLAHKRINPAQYLAGREYQKHARAAYTADELIAQRWLDKCQRELGDDGVVLLRSLLIHGMSLKQIAEARGLTGQDWQRYYAKRFSECLNALAIVYGFSNREKRIRASGAKTPIIGAQ